MSEDQGAVPPANVAPPTLPLIEDARFKRTREFAHRFLRRPAGVVSLVLILIVLFFAVFQNLAATHDPIATNFDARFEDPSVDHLLGTDNLGRDTFSRVVHGSRTAVLVGLISVAIGLGVGLPYGLLSGYLGGWKDEVAMRVMDALYAFPAILLALIVIAALGTGITNVMIAIGVVFVPGFARIARGSTLSVKRTEYILAAEALGASTLRIAFVHVLPNTLAPIIVQASLSIGFAIIAEASLSFLGLGTQPPDPSWGSMLQASQRFLTSEGALAIYPGAAIVLTVLAFNLFGDVLRDLLDPRLRGAD
ncbi:MAG: peptide/nickel transport system permease protein [Chloroflexi bacterium]|jgi:peptide/nickel transport system permease protein|nr:MAG: peptide/nickel transport system permease protein [Chloroflexota bacterium]